MAMLVKYDDVKCKIDGKPIHLNDRHAVYLSKHEKKRLHKAGAEISEDPGIEEALVARRNGFVYKVRAYRPGHVVLFCWSFFLFLYFCLLSLSNKCIGRVLCTPYQIAPAMAYGCSPRTNHIVIAFVHADERLIMIRMVSLHLVQRLFTRHARSVTWISKTGHIR